MRRQATRMKLKGAGVVLAFALLAPAGAHGASIGHAGPEQAVRNATSPGETTVVAPQATTGKGGLGWHEAAVGAGVLLGIVLLGLWGDVAVGAVVVGAAAVLGAGATLVTRIPTRRQRAVRVVPNARAAGSVVADSGAGAAVSGVPQAAQK
jgi:hypothetical protein